jgi:pimeloyl-ACP methyl ester carboxylesterase
MSKLVIENLNISGHCGTSLFGKITCPQKGGPFPGVLLIHGLRSDSREFGGFPEALSHKGYMILSFDYSGHGQSKGQPLLITASSYRDDTLAALSILKERGAFPIYVLGHSFGVYAALLSSYNERVMGAVLTCPQYRSGASLKGIKRFIFFITGATLKFLEFLIPNVYLYTKKNYFSLFEDQGAVEWAEQIDWDPGRIHLRTLALAFDANNMSLARITQKPLLVIRCAQDRKVSKESTMKLVNAIPPQKCHYLELPNSGHSPFQDFDRIRLVNEIDIFFKSILN